MTEVWSDSLCLSMHICSCSIEDGRVEREEDRPLLGTWCIHCEPRRQDASMDVIIINFLVTIKPTCHVNHLPGFLKKYDEFKAKGVDVIAVVAANDPFVMSGWGRVEGVEDKVR